MFKKIIEGIVKKLNKGKKNVALMGVDSRDKQYAHKGAATANDRMNMDRVKTHLASRGVKTKGQELKNPAPSGIGASNRAKGFAALDAAGMFRRQGNKNSAKNFVKQSKAYRQMETTMIVTLAKMLAEDFANDISKVGGSADEYRKIKAKKDAKLASAVRNTRGRKDALGSKGGMYDKKGNPARDERANGDQLRKGKVQKPMPLNLRGKPGKGKAMNSNAVRGKSINTSRADSNKIARDTENRDRVASAFLSKLSKSKDSK